MTTLPEIKPVNKEFITKDFVKVKSKYERMLTTRNTVIVIKIFSPEFIDFNFTSPILIGGPQTYNGLSFNQ